MPSRIRIAVSSNPSHGMGIVLWFQNIDLDYDNTQTFTFVNGVPANANQIAIGVDAAATITNLFTAFQTLFVDFVVSMDDDDILITYPNSVEGFNLSVVNTTLGAVTVTTEDFILPDPEPAEPAFEIADLSIEIIDTYENDRTLRVEVTRESAPKLIFDSGDSILEPLMASELKFDMRVPGAEDAFFKHLFTGDEKRFLTKLNAIDIEENTKMLWQGFLLPDLYSETYKNGNLFVEFSATDMIATLKNKYFKPWEYHRKINIMRLLSEIMQQTGVAQKFVVMPALIPDAALVPWYYLNLELSVYYDGKKGENLYELLSSVLKSNLLTIRSFEGYWWIEGVNRKFEPSGNALLFDESGVYENVFEFSRTTKQFNFVAGTLLFTSISPIKTVSIDVEKPQKSLFSEDIVKISPYYGVWSVDEWDKTSQKTKLFNQWNRNAASYFTVLNNDQFNFGSTAGLFSSPYNNMNEAASLVNYFESPEKPYVFANVGYVFSLKINVDLQFLPVPELNYVEDVVFNSGLLESFVLYQCFINEQEIMSNRNGYGGSLNSEFTLESISKKNTNNIYNLKISLSIYFESDIEGYFSVRFLACDTNSLITQYGFGYVGYRVLVDELKLDIDEDFLDKDIVISERNVNFTTLYSIEIKDVFKNYGLGMQLTPYQKTIPVGVQLFLENIHVFNTDQVNKLITWRFSISVEDEAYLFRKDYRKACYITRVDGEESYFNSLYTKRNTFSGSLLPFLYYLTDKLNQPKYPKDYRFLPKIETGDVLTILLSDYPEENLANRLRWKIYGETAVQSFSQTIAKIIHQMHPDVFYGVEGTMLGLFFPGEIFQHYYDGDLRDFVASRIEMDLFDAKTTVTGREIKYSVLTDISYE